MSLRRKAIVWLLSGACAAVFSLSSAPAQEQERVVYVVPDLGTYLYAISLWDKDIQFPVFLRGSRFLDIFLRGYPGAKLKELERKRMGKITEALAYRALYAAWGPETLDDAPPKVTRQELTARLKALGVVPQGIVVANVSDAEFPGGFALAAGHRQPLAFYKSPAKRSHILNYRDNSAREATKEKIRKDVLDLVKEWGYHYEGLGEGIDYITLAVNMPHTYRVEQPETEQKFNPGLSMTDAIGRLTPSGLVEADIPGGPRRGEPAVYAYCGQLIEAAPEMALFQAMSSLFAETDKALYFHRWAGRLKFEGVKGYQVLRTKVHTITRDERGDPRPTLKEWHRLTDGGHGFDFIHVAAAGGTHKWFDGTVEDIPEGGPCAVFFAQSGSTANPALTDTLAGRWLLNGAYVYYGAASEPYAAAFNTAQTVARTLAAGGTYGEAFQRKDTLPPQFRKPWRLVYVGDPLARPRFTQDPEEPEWSRTWRRGVALVRDAAFAEAVKLLEGVFGQVPDGRAGELWADLLRAYELAVGIGTFKAPEPKRFFTPLFVDGWMLPWDVAEQRPETGWLARLHLRLVKDVELANLLTGRASVEELPDSLKTRLRKEVERLEASAVFAKLWLVVGPLKWEDPEQTPRDFPGEVARKNETFDGPNGAVRWTLKLVERATYTVQVPRARSGADALHTALVLVYLPGEEPHQAALKLAGTAASAAPTPLVWVNRKLVEGEAGTAGHRITLEPGINEIVVRLAARRGRQEPVTFAMSLTEPDGKRSTAFTYVDLIEHLGIRRTPPGGQR